MTTATTARDGDIIVQKYGGSSVATPEKLARVAELVVAKKRSGARVVVVVSAMGDTTDALLAQAREVSPSPDPRELDMLLSAGERISMSLLALAIRAKGEEAVSLTGSQSGIITTASHTHARIMEVRPFRVQDELERGRIPIVAGYQGVSYMRDVTTLGRGGSDTTAVALAAALDARACEIYSDVDGIFTADPRVAPAATSLPEIGYAEMQELAEAGARVMNAEAVEFAKSKGIAIYARKTGSALPGTVIRKDVPAPCSGVRGIAHETRIGFVSTDLNEPCIITEFLLALEAMGAHAKQVTLAERPNHLRHFSCVLGFDNVVDEVALAARVDRVLGEGAYFGERGAVSLIGEGIHRTPTVMRSALEILRHRSIVVRGISTSSFRITFTIGSEDTTEAVRALHAGLLPSHAAADAIIG